MKKILSSEYNLLTARVFLGVLLTVISIDKIADPEAFAQSIAAYRIITGTPALILATILPWIELLCGLTLTAGILVRGSALLTGSLLIIFTVAVVTALVRGLDISCGCFAQGGSDRLSWYKLVENAVLIAISAYLFFSRHHRFTIEEYLRSEPEPSPPSL